MKKFWIYGYTQDIGSLSTDHIRLYIEARTPQEALEERQKMERDLHPEHSFIATGVQDADTYEWVMQI